MSLSWSEEPVTAGPAEQVARAMLAQWRALAAARTVACDRCGEETALEESVQGKYADIYCRACFGAESEGEWTPEEWFEEGAEDA